MLLAITIYFDEPQSFGRGSRYSRLAAFAVRHGHVIPQKDTGFLRRRSLGAVVPAHYELNGVCRRQSDVAPILPTSVEYVVRRPSVLVRGVMVLSTKSAIADLVL